MKNIKGKIVDRLRNLILSYDSKNGLLNTDKPVFICDRIDTRNRNKNDAYKIPADKPQCPIFNDNRCCGGCKEASYCDHSVDCGCFGYTFAARGGTTESNFMRKCTDYSEFGRMKENDEFDWDYYKLNKFNKQVETRQFFAYDDGNSKRVAKVSGKIKSNKTIDIVIVDTNEELTLSVLENNFFSNILQPTYEDALRWCPF